MLKNFRDKITLIQLNSYGRLSSIVQSVDHVPYSVALFIQLLSTTCDEQMTAVNDSSHSKARQSVVLFVC